MADYSVLMAVYGGENPAYLQCAVESILRQTVAPDEILLVCDGPLTAELDGVIHDICHRQPELFRILRLKENRGLGPALNAGLKLCRNEWVARMDSDDVSIPGRMEMQLKALERYPNVSVLGGQIEEFSKEPQSPSYRMVPLTQEKIRALAKLRNPMNHVTAMYRKSHILAAGGYPEFSGPGFEDYFLWVKLLAQGRELRNIPQLCCRVRVNAGQYSRRGGMGYFSNAMEVQRLLLREGMISWPRFWCNGAMWFTSSLLLTAGVRRILFRGLLRKKTLGSEPQAQKQERSFPGACCHEAAGYQS